MRKCEATLETDQVTVEDSQKIESIVAKVLKIREEDVTDQLEYRSIMEWDSLAHVNLMIALEEAYDIRIDADLWPKLNSVAAIRKYIDRQTCLNPSESSPPAYPNELTIVHRGLAGVVFDRTRTTFIDGKLGRLFYRGYSIHDLVQHSTYEEVAYLLLHEGLPTQAQLLSFSQTMRDSRNIPESILEIIRIMKNARPIEVLRTALSALAAYDPESHDTSNHTLQRAIRIISQLPTIVAAHHAIRSGRRVVDPDPTLSHTANFLFMLHGKKPSERAVEILDKVFILHADHGSNASAFTARVVAGTRSDLYASLTAAISAFAGALHGGAVEHVMSMLREIGDPRHAAEYVAQLTSNNKPVMGFGHRVYQTADPRAIHLHRMAKELSAEAGETVIWSIAEAVFDAMRPYAEKGIDVNVDFFASIIYHVLGIPQDLFVATFAIARMPGWISQVQEQIENNILIRPLLQYVGEVDLPFVRIDQRETTVEVSMDHD